MTNPYRYLTEKYEAAVLALATSPAPLRTRLRDAYSDHASRVAPADAPAELRRDVQRLADLMTSAATPHSRIAASVEAMSEEQVARAASLIVEIAFSAQRGYYLAG